MEDRKKLEIEYYDKRAGDSGGLGFLEIGSYKFLYDRLGEICQGKIVLDYGCGRGTHSLQVAKMGAARVVGIDLSERSLEEAKYKLQNTKYNIQFLKMDCEKMEFPDNSFDVIFDGGTFSSIDLSRAWPEMARVLKPEGILIGIETFGHNPITNLKRKLNKLTGNRTAWATAHIFKTKDLEQAKKYFNKSEVYYFHLISWLAFPFLKWPGGKSLLRFLEFFDRMLLRAPFLRKYAFKVVFIFQK